MKSREDIIIYTDGGCRGNPGLGSWASILISEKHKVRLEIGESVENTTNNKMEMLAAINSLKKLKRTHNVKLYSDSVYLINGINNWIKVWLKNGWKKSDKKPVENKDLWIKLLEISKKHEISFIKVKGHSSVKENERADEIVNILMDRHKETGKTASLNIKSNII